MFFIYMILICYNVTYMKLLLSSIIIGILLISTSTANASTDLQNSILQKEKQIQQLEQQINQYQNEMQYYTGQAKTLGGEIANINSSTKTLQTSIKSTNTKIEKAGLTIDQNVSQIQDLTKGIITNKQAIAETLRQIQINDNRAPVEILLSQGTISEFFQDQQDLKKLQNTLRGTVQVMNDRTNQLTKAQKELVLLQGELKDLSGELTDKEKILLNERRKKDAVLKETKNKESEYQRQIVLLEKQKEQIDAEVRDYESQLKFSLNPQSLPPIGQSALGWPIESVTLTQQFGKTVDAKRLYLSGSHSGVDFRAAVGTPIFAAADGVIEGVGDTDLTCPKASFGKWVFIRHNNGLSTAYGHLSLIKAIAGKTVKKGDLIAYSGNSGHTTGPHLHLTVYASNGVDGQEGARITERPSSACVGKNYTMPLAPTNAYLDPMLYLPTTGFTLK